MSLRALTGIVVALLLPASAGARMDGDYGGHTTTCGTVSFQHHAGRITNNATGPYPGLFRTTAVGTNGSFSASSEDYGIFHGTWQGTHAVHGHYYYRPPRDDNYPRWRAYHHVPPAPGHYSGHGVSFSVAEGQVHNFDAPGVATIASIPLHRYGFAVIEELQAACGSWKGHGEVHGYYRVGRAFGSHPVVFSAHLAR
jgi:hypothetical protein